MSSAAGPLARCAYDFWETCLLNSICAVPDRVDSIDNLSDFLTRTKKFEFIKKQYPQLAVCLEVNLREHPYLVKLFADKLDHLPEDFTQELIDPIDYHTVVENNEIMPLE